jgi:hypothetical protein
VRGPYLHRGNTRLLALNAQLMDQRERRQPVQRPDRIRVLASHGDVTRAVWVPAGTRPGDEIMLLHPGRTGRLAPWMVAP